MNHSPGPNLRALQEHFFKSITSGNAAQVLSFIKPSHITEDARFKVYRNTAVENLHNSLKTTFPGIWQLIGEECARGVARAFTMDIKNLPTSGSIDDWGKDFPKFLSTLPELSDLKYLEDYASFEWLQHLSFCAGDAEIFDATELQKVPGDMIEKVKFSFHPSVFFLRSEYPLDQIYEMLEDLASSISKINLNDGPSHTILNRISNHTNMLWVTCDYFDLASLLSKGNNLGEAIVATQVSNPEFDFAQGLGFILNKGLVSSITVPRV